MENHTAIQTTEQGSLTDLASQINAEHRHVEASMNDGLQHALRAGELLTSARALCDHGTWLPWLQKNFDGKKRTAQAYMRIAKEFPRLKRKAQRVALLSFRQAIVETSNNVQIVAKQVPSDQGDILDTWDGEQCRDARRALTMVQVKRTTKQPSPRLTLNVPESKGLPVCGNCSRPIADIKDDYCEQCQKDMLAQEDRNPSALACPNCGATEYDDDGDCASCHEPGVAEAKAAPDGEHSEIADCTDAEWKKIETRIRRYATRHDRIGVAWMLERLAFSLREEQS